MKKVFLMPFILVVYLLKSQYVEIPDLQFRNFLQTQYPSCFNSSNQLDTTCVQVLSEKDMTIKDYIFLANLKGINYFKNLENLYISGNSLDKLSNLPDKLKKLTVINEKLIKVDSLPNSIREINFSNNYIREVVRFPDSLRSFIVTNNRLSKLPTQLPKFLNHVTADSNYFAAIPTKPNSVINSIDWFFSNQKKYLPSNVKGYITVTDTLLRSILKYQFPSCFNAQNQLDTNCADILNVVNYSPRETFENKKNVNPKFTTLFQIQDLSVLKYFKSLVYLNINNTSATTLPKFSNTLQILDVSSNKLTSVNILNKLIKKLDISSNNIIKIDALPDSLIYLNMSGNKISKLPNLLPVKLIDVFASFNCFESTPVKPNNITGNWNFENQWKYKNNLLPAYITIKDDAFRNALKTSFSKSFNLKDQLDTNSLEIINTYYFNALNLDNQNKDKIEEFDEIKYFKNLQFLNLLGNSIKKLPLLPPSIKDLNLQFNFISNIDNLPKGIERLNLSYNKFTEINKLPDSLKNLEINYNKLSTVPSKMPKNLNGFYAQYNCFSSIPNKPNGYLGAWNFSNQWDMKTFTPPAFITIEDSSTIKAIKEKGSFRFCFDKYNHFDKTCNLIQQDSTLMFTLPTPKSIDVLDNFINLKKLHLTFTNYDTTLVFSDSTSLLLNKQSLKLRNPNLKELYILGSVFNIDTLPQNINKLVINGYCNNICPMPSSLQSLILSVTSDANILLNNNLRDVTIAGRVRNIKPTFPDSIKTLTIGSANKKIFSNLLEPLDLTNTKINTLNIHNTALTTFPKLPNSLRKLDLSNNKIAFIEAYALPEKLEELNMGANKLKCMPMLPNSLKSIWFDYDSIACLPNIGPNLMGLYYDTLTQNNVLKPFVYPICNKINNINACYSVSTVSGYVFLDENQNDTLDLGEKKMSNYKIKLGNKSTFTNSEGYYQLSLDTLGTYNLQADTIPHFGILNKLRVLIVNSTDTTIVHNFAVLPNKDTIIDLKTYLCVVNRFARPGFNYVYRVLVKNEGSILEDAHVIFNFDTSRFLVDSISHSEFTVKHDSIVGVIDSLMPWQSKYVNIYGRIKPSVTLGDSIFAFSQVADTSGTSLSFDTTFAIIRGSFDPNDKIGTRNLTPIQVKNGEFINYTINFQNMGTDTAFTVIVKDTLSNMLDYSSLEMLASSHRCKVLTNKSIVKFEFANILLPDNKTNEVASHGFVDFRIKPLKIAKEGDYINNKAAIYFDFNAPIITNTTSTYIGYPKNITLGIALEELDYKTIIYPNPVIDNVTVLNDSYLQIFTLQGKELYSGNVSKNDKLNLQAFPKGIYIYKLDNKIGKLIKE